jgi:hypothetical protein
LITRPTTEACTRHRRFRQALLSLSQLSRVSQGRKPIPTRPVRLTVGFPAIGGNDVMAGLMGQSLSERLAGAVAVPWRLCGPQGPD